LYRIPRFADELARFRAINNCFGFLKLVAKADLLVLDDFGLAPMTDGVPIRSDVSSASDKQHLPGMLGFGAQTESHAEDSGGWLTHPNDKPV